MKIAFVDNLPVAGGLSRFSYNLCKSFVDYYPSVSIDYYIHNANVMNIPEIYKIDRVTVKILESSRLPALPIRIKNKLVKKLGKVSLSDDPVIEEIEEKINGKYDLAYFPSAHMMKRPDLTIAVVGTLHDFNWKYFFGRQIFSLAFVEMMDIEIQKWMSGGFNICSSQDVVDEAKKLYPAAKRFPAVVNIGPVVFEKSITPETSAEIMAGLNIYYPYIIFPGNFFPHKNHLNLFTAFSYLKKRRGFENYKLLLTGMNSDQIPYGIAEKRGVEVFLKTSKPVNFDVRGMGYLSNEQIDVLIKNAKLLVSPSIYEAICTPAMDAWNFGTPTAISDIAPFREHEKTWGIRTAFFDPMNPENIADVIEDYLNNYTQALQDGIISKNNMANYSWQQVAKGYMDIFKQAITAT